MQSRHSSAANFSRRRGVGAKRILVNERRNRAREDRDGRSRPVAAGCAPCKAGIEPSVTKWPCPAPGAVSRKRLIGDDSPYHPALPRKWVGRGIPAEPGCSKNTFLDAALVRLRVSGEMHWIPRRGADIVGACSKTSVMKMKHSDLQPRHSSPSAWNRAERYGIDVSLLKANLRLTIAERLRHHDVALRTMLSLREAVRKKYASTG